MWVPTCWLIPNTWLDGCNLHLVRLEITPLPPGHSEGNCATRWERGQPRQRTWLLPDSPVRPHQRSLGFCMVCLVFLHFLILSFLVPFPILSWSPFPSLSSFTQSFFLCFQRAFILFPEPTGNASQWGFLPWCVLVFFLRRVVVVFLKGTKQMAE